MRGVVKDQDQGEKPQREDIRVEEQTLDPAPVTPLAEGNRRGLVALGGQHRSQHPRRAPGLGKGRGL